MNGLLGLRAAAQARFTEAVEASFWHLWSTAARLSICCQPYRYPCAGTHRDPDTEGRPLQSPMSERRAAIDMTLKGGHTSPIIMLLYSHTLTMVSLWNCGESGCLLRMTAARRLHKSRPCQISYCCDDASALRCRVAAGTTVGELPATASICP